jgi:hypothetical protein
MALQSIEPQRQDLAVAALGDRRARAHPARSTLARVALAVLGIKAYTLAFLYVTYRQVDMPGRYQPFLCLDAGQKRAERLGEIRGSFIERLAPYDGQYYLDIAERGYRRLGRRELNARMGPAGNYAFFPLYPALLWLAGPLGQRGAVAAMVFLNVALSSAAAVALYHLAFRLGLPAWPSVLFLLTFPTAVFQDVLYTESLFLFLTVAVALLALDGRFRTGSVLGYLAGLTRPQGLLVSALCLGSAPGGTKASPGRKQSRAWQWVAAGAPALGIVTFSVVLWLSIGAPLGFLGIQSSWARDFSPASLLRELASPGSYKGPPFDLLALLFGVGLVPLLWRYLPRSLALYGTLSVVLPLSTGTMLSFGRFISVSFPHFLCLAKIFERWRVARLVLLLGFVTLQAILLRGLIAWHFVG